MVFLPRTDINAQELARTLVESEILRFGFYLYGWRQAPVDSTALGAKGNAVRPEIEQVLFYDPRNRPLEELERTLFIIRRRIEKRALEASLPSFYICSLSPKDIVYKGMFLAEKIR